MNIEAGDIKKLLLRVYKKYHNGTISESKAYKEAFLLKTILKDIEVTDLENRVKQIENTLKE